MKTHDRLNCPACGMPTILDDGHNTPDMALCNVCDEQEEMDTMSTHTPGPWTIAGEEHANVICGKDFVVADVYYHQPDEASPRTDEEADANARLIASAPELLAACREAQLLIHYLLCGTPDEAHDLLVNQGEEIESLLRHAIAKAEGRG